MTELIRPALVVEIGVEHGYSSAVILAGMAARGGGKLYSIDLPQLGEDKNTSIGKVIPEELRDSWELTLGPSRQRLPEVLRQTPAIDLLLHDGDHSYQSQYEDLERAWPKLRVGGVAVIDDVWTTAAIDFARKVGEEPILVERWDTHDAIGLIRKSANTTERERSLGE